MASPRGILGDKQYGCNDLNSRGAPGSIKPKLLILGVVVILAVAADVLVMGAFRAKRRLPPSAVLPAIVSLHELRLLVREHPEEADLHLSLGQAYLRIHHYLSASEEFSACLNSHGDERAALTGRAQANIRLDRFDVAVPDMERLIRMRPSVLATYLTLSETQQHSDDWAAAKKTLDRVPRGEDGFPMVQTDPVDAAELLATAYSHIDRWGETRALVDLCLKKEPRRQSARIMLGKTLHATGKPVEALPYLIEAVTTAPKFAELHYLLGTAFKARHAPGDDDRAAACFQRVVTLDDKHGAATLALAKECDRRNIYAAAAFAYMRAFKLGMEGETNILRSGNLMLKAKNIEEGHYRRGLYFETIGRPDLALEEYKILARMHDCCRSGYVHMGRAYAQMSQHEKTVECLLKAQKLEPARAKELDWLIIDALGQSHEDDESLKRLRAIVREGGKDGIEACFQLAKLANTAGKLDEAEQWLNKCVESDPKDAVFRAERGRFLLQQRGDAAKLKAAIRDLEAALPLSPDDRNAFYSLGLAYSYSGNLEDSILALRHAVDLQPENGDSYPSLARVLNMAARKQEAAGIQQLVHRYEAFRQTRDTLLARCKRDPTNAGNQMHMAEFHMRAHEYAGALERYRKVLVLQPGNRQARSRLAEACGYMGRRQEQREQLASLNKGAEAAP